MNGPGRDPLSDSVCRMIPAPLPQQALLGVCQPRPQVPQAPCLPGPGRPGKPAARVRRQVRGPAPPGLGSPLQRQPRRLLTLALAVSSFAFPPFDLFLADSHLVCLMQSLSGTGWLLVRTHCKTLPLALPGSGKGISSSQNGGRSGGAG